MNVFDNLLMTRSKDSWFMNHRMRFKRRKEPFAHTIQSKTKTMNLSSRLVCFAAIALRSPERDRACAKCIPKRYRRRSCHCVTGHADHRGSRMFHPRNPQALQPSQRPVTRLSKIANANKL